MNCQKVLELLSSYLDQQLSDEQYRAVSSHLATCAQCREILEQMQTVQSQLQGLDEVDPPPDFVSQVMARLDKEEAQQQQQTRKKLQNRRWYVKRLVAACALFFLSVGYGLYPLTLENDLASFESEGGGSKTFSIQSAPLAENSMQITTIEPDESSLPLANDAQNKAETPEIQRDESALDEEMPEMTNEETSEQEVASIRNIDTSAAKDEEVTLFSAEEKLSGTPEEDTASKQIDKRYIISGAGVLLAIALFYFSRVKN